jgi:hypothetical protein
MAKLVDTLRQGKLGLSLNDKKFLNYYAPQGENETRLLKEFKNLLLKKYKPSGKAPPPVR